MSTATIGAGTRAGQQPPDELWRWTAVEIARGVRTRLISSRDAVESCLRRIELTNPAVNALAEVCTEEFRRLMPLVEQLGNEGMRRAAATYFAAAERWGDRRPTSARTSTRTPAAGRWCGGCRSRRRTTRCC